MIEIFKCSLSKVISVSLDLHLALLVLSTLKNLYAFITLAIKINEWVHYISDFADFQKLL